MVILSLASRDPARRSIPPFRNTSWERKHILLLTKLIMLLHMHYLYNSENMLNKNCHLSELSILSSLPLISHMENLNKDLKIKNHHFFFYKTKVVFSKNQFRMVHIRFNQQNIILIWLRNLNMIEVPILNPNTIHHVRLFSSRIGFGRVGFVLEVFWFLYR